jgi:hypothetical protein
MPPQKVWSRQRPRDAPRGGDPALCLLRKLALGDEVRLRAVRGGVLEVQEREGREAAQGRGVFVLRGRTGSVSGLKGVDGGEQKKKKKRE